jgi:hypothetical protein
MGKINRSSAFPDCIISGNIIVHAFFEFEDHHPSLRQRRFHPYFFPDRIPYCRIQAVRDIYDRALALVNRLLYYYLKKFLCYGND